MKRPLAVLALLTGLVTAASADVVGYFITGAPGNNAGANTAITAAGHTPIGLTNLTAADFAAAQIDVLWILESSNSAYSATITTNLTDIFTFVRLGGTMSFHDRMVNNGATSAADVLPGASGTAFTRSLGTDIDIITGSTLVTNGPGGIITNTTLDGGNFSNHGFAGVGTLPVGALAIFSTANPAEVVDFTYQFGAGNVYYSTIPLDFYLGGGSAFATIYAPNEVAFQASLGAAVPEPATIALTAVGLGLAGLCGNRLRRRRKARR